MQPAAAATPIRTGQQRQRALLLRADRAAQRRVSIHVEPASGQARHRAADQRQPHLGRADRRRAQHDAGRACCCRWATPFGLYWAGPIAGAVALAGFAGSMTMSGIKRDRGVKDYGTLVSGHAGVLDRIDSLCFAAPVFFHITRFFFSTMQ